MSVLRGYEHEEIMLAPAAEVPVMPAQRVGDPEKSSGSELPPREKRASCSRPQRLITVAERSARMEVGGYDRRHKACSLRSLKAEAFVAECVASCFGCHDKSPGSVIHLVPGRFNFVFINL